MTDSAREHLLPEEAARLAAKLRKHLPELRKRYHIGSLSLFGSYVRGEQRADSDVDVLIEFTQTPSLFDFIELEDEMANLLGLKVDLVMRSSLREPVKRYIINEAVPV
jgi:predicted nucleotidyltransferase